MDYLRRKRIAELSMLRPASNCFPTASLCTLCVRRLLVDHAISGVQVHDARLVAAMQVHGVFRILTFNTKDFKRFSGIQAIHPLQAISG